MPTREPGALCTELSFEKPKSHNLTSGRASNNKMKERKGKLNFSKFDENKYALKMNEFANYLEAPVVRLKVYFLA